MESITSHDDGRSIINQLDFTDKQEFDFATRGLIAAPEQLEIRSEDDKVVWTQGAYHFLEDVDATDAPNSVNPSLWRHTQLNYIYGLFEVVPGIYQVRGYDMANITFIKGDTGWVVIDPLMTVETSRAALQLINKHLGERPITGIIYSHTHIDHFGGVKGIITEEEIQQRAIPLVAPQGFEEYAVSENLFAGTAMGRRAGYQYGTMLKPGAEGRMSIGIGMGQSVGTTSYIPPRDGKGDLQDALVRETGDVRVIDGVEMVFQMTPGTEAPAEMNTWFPAHKALWMAENCNATMHNLYTLRGAQVRDGNAWAHCLMESLSLFGDQAQVVFQSHNWPRWGNDVAKEYLLNTAALYKFTNDQSLLYINQGYSAEEIAHKITLPVDLAQLWYLRPYYGTLAHNAKAVYQKYMGWYDGNPALLNKLPRAEHARKLVEYLGDTDKVLAKARADYEKGEYQWVAEITNALVFANPENQEARELCADALQQLGYRAESGIWRNAYLSGALELRQGLSLSKETTLSGGNDMIRGLQPTMVFDYLGIRLDSNAAQDLNFTVCIDMRNDTVAKCDDELVNSGNEGSNNEDNGYTASDRAESYLLTIKSGVLLHQPVQSIRSVQLGQSDLSGQPDLKTVNADVTLTLPRQKIALLLAPEQLFKQLKTGQPETDGCIAFSGDIGLLRKMYQAMAEFDKQFNLIEP